MAKDFYKAIEERRSIYGISNETVVSDERIQKVISDAVKYAPTAFNSQNGRVVLLLGEHHNRLWNITKEVLRKRIAENKFSRTEQKLDSFRSGYGTVLFFEEQEIVEKLQAQFPTYKDNFPVWSQHSSGILQYIIWTSLEVEGFGASLQHYNPLIDDEVKKEWGIQDSWKLIAQMPFGRPTAGPSEKEFQPLEERILIFK